MAKALVLWTFFKAEHPKRDNKHPFFLNGIPSPRSLAFQLLLRVLHVKVPLRRNFSNSFFLHFLNL